MVNPINISFVEVSCFGLSNIEIGERSRIIIILKLDGFTLLYVVVFYLEMTTEYDYTPEEERVKPSQISDVYAVVMIVPKHSDENYEIYGQWLVFRNYDEVDETWDMIVKAMKNDELQGCSCASCSTRMYLPTSYGPGPQTRSVICVCTYEHNVDTIGFKLVELVKHDIKYKTLAASEEYKYVHAGLGKVTIKTIYYNDGSPSFDLKEDMLCDRSHQLRETCEDKWHLNVVDCPGLSPDSSEYGKWILTLEYLELISLWHILKKKIEMEKEKFGILRMVCPPKRNYISSFEKPVFHVYTNKECMDMVGFCLIDLLECDIVYELKNGHPRYKTLLWNDGSPSYNVEEEASADAHLENREST